MVGQLRFAQPLHAHILLSVEIGKLRQRFGKFVVDYSVAAVIGAQRLFKADVEADVRQRVAHGHGNGIAVHVEHAAAHMKFPEAVQRLADDRVLAVLLRVVAVFRAPKAHHGHRVRKVGGIERAVACIVKGAVKFGDMVALGMVLLAGQLGEVAGKVDVVLRRFLAAVVKAVGEQRLQRAAVVVRQVAEARSAAALPCVGKHRLACRGHIPADRHAIAPNGAVAAKVRAHERIVRHGKARVVLLAPQVGGNEVILAANAVGRIIGLKRRDLCGRHTGEI